MMKTAHQLCMDSPLGPLTLTEQDGTLVALSFSSSEREETPLLLDAEKQLSEYFEGKRKCFELPLRPAGTDFQMAVWQALTAIPYGQTRSYGDIARALGKPGAARAIGQANHRNPLPILIPCHRVIGADGSMTGYGGKSGIPIKRRLLELEQQHL